MGIAPSDMVATLPRGCTPFFIFILLIIIHADAHCLQCGTSPVGEGVRLQAFLLSFTLFFYSLPKLPSTATRLCLVSGPLEGPLTHIYMVYMTVPEGNPS